MCRNKVLFLEHYCPLLIATFNLCLTRSIPEKIYKYLSENIGGSCYIIRVLYWLNTCSVKGVINQLSLWNGARKVSCILLQFLFYLGAAAFIFMYLLCSLSVSLAQHLSWRMCCAAVVTLLLQDRRSPESLCSAKITAWETRTKRSTAAFHPRAQQSSSDDAELCKWADQGKKTMISLSCPHS